LTNSDQLETYKKPQRTQELHIDATGKKSRVEKMAYCDEWEGKKRRKRRTSHKLSTIKKKTAERSKIWWDRVRRREE